MAEFPVTDRTRVRQVPRRGAYDKETVYRILDEGLICHVGFVEDGQPFVMPTLYARLEHRLVLHGSPGSRMLRHLAAGNRACVTVTLVDGLVLARSVFHHSVNYRSVVVLGAGRLVTAEAERLRALERLTEHIVPGRWSDARRPSAEEMRATAVVEVSIDEASAKVRTGPPVDDEEDYTFAVWAGVLPLEEVALAPLADPRLRAGIALPRYVRDYDRRRARAE
jgi:nitroimidazol reductase NimA-like FMN-containing flavoprotein (pyridoxamine 5'-phosphate oxidase superfamily)